MNVVIGNQFICLVLPFDVLAQQHFVSSALPDSKRADFYCTPVCETLLL